MISLSYSTAKWGGGEGHFHGSSRGLDDVSMSSLKEISPTYPPQKKVNSVCFRKIAIWITVMRWSDKRIML